jgi:transcriptional regulator with XRE-family HTH domain
LGISSHYLSAVERGINQLSYEILVHAINVLECSADDIFGEVIDHGMTVKACALEERLNTLVPAEKARILAVLETLIETAQKK